MARLDCYVRVSKVGGREGESFISPQMQSDRCHQHASLHGHDIVRVWEELDASGGSDDRPMWQEMLARVERGDTDGVIVARLDRFSRSVYGALTALDRIEQAGGVFVSVGDHIDATSPTGRLMLNILLSMAQWQREEAAASFRASRRHAIDRGIHIVARVPFGYRKAGRGKPLEPDPVTGPVVAEIFRRRAAGERYAAIYTDLNARGVTTGDGGQWTTAGISQLVGNRAYLGEARSGDIVNPRAHEPLVDEDTWTVAQAAKSATPHRSRKSLLAGMIRCAGCSRSLTGGGSVAYFCHGRHAAGRCPSAASIRQRFADEWVQARFFEWISGDLQPSAGADSEEVEAARVRLAVTAAELEAWRDTVSVLDVGPDVYRDGLSARARSHEAAFEQLERLVVSASAHRDLPSLPTLRDAWPGMGVAERREVLAAGIDVVFLRGGRRPVGERLHICWRGEGPRNLPRPARLTPIVGFRFPDDVDGDAGAGVASL